MKTILNRLFNNYNLSRNEAKNILIDFARGKYNASQMAAFLTVFQMRPITLPELQGFREGMLDLCVDIQLEVDQSIDLCGTGGDGKNTFNISTLASFVLAGAGYKVTKHGNYGVSSSVGSSNILEHLGYRFSNDERKLNRELKTAGICFLHAPVFHPAMKNVAPVRKEMAVKTFFNLLGPMVNPVQPSHQLIGVFNLEIARMYHYIYQDSDKKYMILHSLDGYDEVSLTGDCRLYSNEGETTISPALFHEKPIDPALIHGGTTKEKAADIFLSVLKNESSPAQKSVVLANASLAIQNMEPRASFQECLSLAKSSIEKGRAYNVFLKLMKNQ